jgi:hypothetical protein
MHRLVTVVAEPRLIELADGPLRAVALLEENLGPPVDDGDDRCPTERANTNRRRPKTEIRSQKKSRNSRCGSSDRPPGDRDAVQLSGTRE